MLWAVTEEGGSSDFAQAHLFHSSCQQGCVWGVLLSLHRCGGRGDSAGPTARE